MKMFSHGKLLGLCDVQKILKCSLSVKLLDENKDTRIHCNVHVQPFSCPESIAELTFNQTCPCPLIL